jgi:hypothetical protein
MDQPHHVQLHHPEVAATAADLSSNLVHRLETTVVVVAKEADMVVDRLVLQSRFLPAVGTEEIPDLAMALDQPQYQFKWLLPKEAVMVIKQLELIV